MIQFMVIGAPRSGTAWASNWLTTETTHCLHDPLWKYRVDELDLIDSEKMLGISCTGLFMLPGWLNAHPARKVILHRDIDEILDSSRKHGIPELPRYLFNKLDDVDGLHVDWKDLFNKPAMIHEFLTELPFDYERHAHLKTLNIQNILGNIVPDLEMGQRFFKQLNEVMHGLL